MPADPAGPESAPATAKPRRDADRRLIAWENTCTPSAFLGHAAEAMAPGADPALAAAFAESAALADLRNFPAPQPFVEEPLAAGAALMRGAAAPTGRRLLVLFTGRLGRPLLALPVFLQRVPAAEWDVLLLRDPGQTHYRDGAEGFARTFPDLCARIGALAAPYAGMLAFGTSMGGLPAIRFALNRGGIRGISVCGLPAWDVARLMRDGSAPPAFDPICACLPQARRPFFFLHAAGNAADGAAAATAAAATGGVTIPVARAEGHGLLGKLWRDGRFDGFLAACLAPAATADSIAAALVPPVRPRKPDAQPEPRTQPPARGLLSRLGAALGALSRRG